MRKILLIILLCISLFLVGCHAKYENCLIQIQNEEIGLDIELTEEESTAILKILNDSEWKNDVTKTDCPYLFKLSEQSIAYSDEAGLFNDKENQRHLIVTEGQRAYIRSLLLEAEKSDLVGKTYEEVLAGCSGLPVQEYLNYVFYVNPEGNNVVVAFDGERKLVERAEIYSAVEPEEDDFASITVGMSVFDVVKKVGHPSQSVTFGLATMDFEGKNGALFRILWDGEMKVAEVTRID